MPFALPHRRRVDGVSPLRCPPYGQILGRSSQPFRQTSARMIESENRRQTVHRFAERLLGRACKTHSIPSLFDWRATVKFEANESRIESLPVIVDRNVDTPPDLTDRLEVAIRASHAAGEILCEGFRSGVITHDTKANRNDPVTEFDLRADGRIVDIIRDHFPKDGVLTEESGEDGVCSNGQWVIDPLDGTNNFSRHIPHFAVSIAFCDRYRPLVACIFDPMRNESYSAVRGKGAHLNESPIWVSAQAALEGAFLGVGTSTRPVLRESIHKQMTPFLRAARVVRTTGSASLDLAYVAAGRFDGAWYPNLHWWDVAAGILLVEEAGGRSTDYQGQPFLCPTSSLVASNKRIHNALLGYLEEEPDGAK